MDEIMKVREWKPANDEQADARMKRNPPVRKSFLNYWCIDCENARTHAMITEELGTCVSCGKQHWAPMGHGD